LYTLLNANSVYFNPLKCVGEGKTRGVYVGKEKREINPLEELEKKQSKRRQ
jgi:hypothetical protein